MKKYVLLCLTVCLAITLISWGHIGHQTIANIAEKHLTPRAKAAINDLLDNQSMVDVSSWADDVVNQPKYKHTASWHFLNELPGLSYIQFKNDIANLNKDNVYSALLKSEHILMDNKNSHAQRAVALKFIIHLVGDAHQPMHVSRAEDKGGNAIHLQFDDKDVNLHSLWDSRLIDHDRLTPAQMAKAYDTANLQQIKQWQSDDITKWLYESYQISGRLYSEVGLNDRLGETYFKQHIGIARQRMEMGGIRLAGFLNEIFRSTIVTPNHPPQLSKAKEGINPPGKKIDVNNAGKYIGENVTVTAKVYGAKDFGSMVLVNVGAAYPKNPLTIVLRGLAKHITTNIKGKTITVTGILIDFKGKPDIEVTDLKQIQIP